MLKCLSIDQILDLDNFTTAQLIFKQKGKSQTSMIHRLGRFSQLYHSRNKIIQASNLLNKSCNEICMNYSIYARVFVMPQGGEDMQILDILTKS